MKNLSNIKNNVINARFIQSKRRAADSESTERADDLIRNVYEGLYGKAMRHEADGTPNVLDIENTVFALQSGNQIDFDAIELGGARKQANPTSSISTRINWCRSRRCFNVKSTCTKFKRDSS